MINQAILFRLNEIFDSTCQKWRCELNEFNGEPDHVHLLISYPPDVAISKLVNNLKTVSSRLIRKEFAEHVNSIYSKPVFWTGAYFVASTGSVTLDQIKAYVESQQSPGECRGIEPLHSPLLSPSPPSAITLWREYLADMRWRI